MADEGVSYFPLYCTLDEKFELIEAEFGLKGFAIVVKLFQRIYKEHGYYCEWNDDISLVFAKQCGITNTGGAGLLDRAEQSSQFGKPKNLIDLVVAASVRRGIFNAQLFKQYSILTSKGIQKNFLNIVRNRKVVEVRKEYLLLSDAEIKVNNVRITESYVRNVQSYVSSEQSKVEESKVNKKTLCKADAYALFERIWKLYPSKKGKGQVSDAKKMKLLEIGFDEMSRAIERYKSELEKDKDWRKPQNGSTFFNSGYVDYLDANYVPGKQTLDKSKNQFNQFMQNNYDYDELEKMFENHGRM